MRLRAHLAAVAAATLAVSGLVLGGSAATAAPPPSGFVPLSDIERPADSTAEGNVYNAWHFDPDHQAGIGSQQPNGFTVDAGGDVLAMLGNGNDAAKFNPSLQPDTTPIDDLAARLSVVTSDNSRVAFQIPVFYGGSGTSWKYTTLRQSATTGGTVWTTSSTITDADNAVLYGQDSSAELADLLTALNSTVDRPARAIGAGFLVWQPTSEVIVSSFTANGQTTRFYEEPQTALNPGNGENVFVHSDDIASDAAVYQGWHEEIPASDSARGSFVTIEADDHIEGLQVTGKSQLIYGYPDDYRPQNTLPEILANGFVIDGTPTGNSFQAQVPLFFYAEGVIGQQFTTLRAVIPAHGAVGADLQWVTSRAIGSIAANGSGTLNDLLAQISSYEVLGHGFTVNSGDVLVKGVAFNGYLHTFYTVAPVASETPGLPDELANSGAGDATRFALVAAVALMLIGGVTLVARRRLS